jgi:hypothetical protein
MYLACYESESSAIAIVITQYHPNVGFSALDRMSELIDPHAGTPVLGLLTRVRDITNYDDQLAWPRESANSAASVNNLRRISS